MNNWMEKKVHHCEILIGVVTCNFELIHLKFEKEKLKKRLEIAITTNETTIILQRSWLREH